MELRNLSCCGIKELTELSWQPSALEALRTLARRLYTAKPLQYHGNAYLYPHGQNRFRYVVFSQAAGRGLTKTTNYGTNFAAAIREHGLGQVVETSPRGKRVPINPNSGNYLKAWIWTVDHTAFKAWWRSEQTAADPNRELNRA